MNTVANHLKHLRVKRGLTQEALAEQSNVSLRTIQRIEMGQVQPRNATLILLFESLGAEMPVNIEDEEGPRNSIKLLKTMNLLIILSMIIPLCNVLVVIIYWIIFSRYRILTDPVRHMLSFQLLWSLSTVLLFFLGVFLSNLITGNAGDGQYVGLIVVVLCVSYNIYTVLRNTSGLNRGRLKLDGPVPNFF